MDDILNFTAADKRNPEIYQDQDELRRALKIIKRAPYKPFPIGIRLSKGTVKALEERGFVLNENTRIGPREDDYIWGYVSW